jgi:hypothetical protein
VRSGFLFVALPDKKSFGIFDPFNFFNFDVFDCWLPFLKIQ